MLFWAVRREDDGLLGKFIKAGANRAIKNNEGKTALDIAIESGHGDDYRAEVAAYEKQLAARRKHISQEIEEQTSLIPHVSNIVAEYTC